MELRVLGPLEAIVDGRAVPLGARKQQLVLAVLAVNAGHQVSVEQLVDELWPDDPPASAVPNVRSYAAALRRILHAMGAHGGGARVTRRGSGYVLELGDSLFDFQAFQVARANGDAASRAGRLD